jgi:acetylornithine aminotransferase
VPGVKEVRGSGLLIGIVLDTDCAFEIVGIARENGLLLNAPAKNIIRIAPALTVSSAQVNEFIKKFSQTLSMVGNSTDKQERK